MKLAVLMAAAGMTNVYAGDDVSFEIGAGGIAIRARTPGQGQWVCFSQETFRKVPLVARGASSDEAQRLSKRLCVADIQSVSPMDSGMLCKVQDCEEDKSQQSATKQVVFDISRKGGRIEIISQVAALEECVYRGFGSNEYYAKAPTRTEAKALAGQLCANEHGGIEQSSIDVNNGFFCDLRECNKLAAPQAGSNPTDIKIGKGGINGNIDADKIKDAAGKLKKFLKF